MTRATASSLVKRLGKLPAINTGQTSCATASASSSSRSFSSSSRTLDDEALTSASSSSKSKAASDEARPSFSSSSASSDSTSQFGRGRRPSRPGLSSSRGGPGGERRPPNLSRLPRYPEWVKGPGKAMFGTPPEGYGPHWVGETPFPLNPYFKPPPPISQRVRDQMWSLHKADSQKNSIRVLSGTFGLTMERTLAVLRLKALEDEMTAKSIPLQSDFQSNMERLLGSSTELPNIKRGQSLPLSDPAPADSKSKPSSTSLGRIVEIDESAESAGGEKKEAGKKEGAGKKGKDTDKKDTAAAVDSALTRALDEERSIQKLRRSSVPTGGPSPTLLRAANTTLSHREREAARKGTHQVPPSKGGARASVVEGRAGWSVLDLGRAAASKKEAAESGGGGGGKGGMESYKGAGTLEKNVKRQEKKQRRRERRQQLAQGGVDPVEAAKEAGVQ